MDDSANRQFYSIPKARDFLNCSENDFEESSSTIATDDNEIQKKTHNSLLSYVCNNIIGSDKTFSGPYGLRTVVYLDFTASGRSLQFIEDYIQNEVLPEYANTHTVTSITSLQTTLFRHEARDVIRNSCNASEHDSVLFVGSGTTGAVHKLIHSLNLTESPIVFVGPYEHHSNILPWMEMGAEVIRISVTNSGTVDVGQLDTYLKIFQSFGKQMIGAFSAASNVTGVVANVDAITITLHKYGALAFWDYAAAAPYVKLDMNPYVGGEYQDLVYKDAVYFSVHKFVGGVGSPGVLIVKKKLLGNPVPHGCGGGTVFFVRRDHHRYLMEPEMKEEGGTADIVGSIRAGLVFQLRDAIGTNVIATQDAAMLSHATKAWQDCPNLVLLGPDPQTTERLPIISFMVYHPVTGLFLHHNFVTAVLNDVFGIQARGGCACAGPYAMDILGMSETVSEKMEELLAEDSRLDRVHLRRIKEYSHREIIRPGFVRINLPYFLDAASLEFVVEAVTLVSQHAWKLLPQYLFNPETGEWRNKNFQTFKDRKWLGHISYSTGQMSYQQPAQVIKGPLPTSHQDCLNKVKEIFYQTEKMNIKVPDQSVMFDDDAKPYRWFLLPIEANACLQNKWKDKPLSPTKLPFCPPSLLLRLGHDVPEMELKSNEIKINEAMDRIRNKKKAYTADENMEEKHISVTKCVEGGGLDLDSSVDQEMQTIQEENNPCSVNLLNALDRGFVMSEKVADSDGDGSGNSYHVESAPKDNESDNVIKSVDFNSNVARKENPDLPLLCSDMSQCVLSPKSVAKNKEGQDGVFTSDKNNLLIRNTLNSAETKMKTEDCNVPACDKVYSDSNKGSDGSNYCNDKNNQQSPSNEEFHGDSTKIKGGKGNETNRWFSPPKVIFKPAVQALEEYNMIQDGDRVLVCLSGGKDSLSLLHTIRQFQFYAKKKGVSFTFGAVTVDPQTTSYDPSPLKRYLAYLGVPYFYESQCIMETANNLPYECASICSFCSRMKRGRIYAAARREGYNVLALGQHLDDLSESFLMSFLHNGSLNTMKAHYTVKEGDLRVIRPFVYVRETELRTFAEQSKLPIISENCPACFEAPKERHRTKQLLAAQEVIFPQVYSSMMSALKPLMARGGQSTKTGAGVGVGVISPDGLNAQDDDDDDIDL